MIQIKRNKTGNDVVRKGNHIKIFPLSPQDNLSLNSNYRVYEMVLKKVFKEKNIHNIAVTGNFGIGKSSILRTFAKRKKKDFLHISMAEFSDNKKEYEQNKLECMLLRQLLSLCRKKELPLSHFQMVREIKSKYSKIIIAFFLALYVGLIYGLIFSGEIAESFKVASKEEVFWEMYSKAYILVGVLTVLLVGVGIYQLLIYTKIKEISANISHTNGEASFKVESIESCLEEYAMELIYSFQVLSKKYDAFVFEDMDRLSNEIYINIFKHLREINYTVNERIKFGKRCRFLYVVNDDVISQLNQMKFFDYIIPVVPELGKYNARENMTKILYNMGIDLKNADIFLELAEEIPELSDFRTMNQIQNEYYIFQKIEIKRLQDINKKTSILDSQTKLQIFAFVMYKTLFPEDYYQIRQMKSIVFPVVNKKEIEERKKKEIRYCIIEKLEEHNFLGIECMRYIGSSRKEIIQMYEMILSMEDIGAKRKILNCDREFLCYEIYRKNKKNRAKYIKNIEDSFMFYLISSEKADEEILRDYIAEIEPNSKRVTTEDDEKIKNRFKHEKISIMVCILEYFIQRGYEDYKWLEVLLDSKDERYYQCIDDMEEEKMNNLIEDIGVDVFKRNEAVVKNIRILRRNDVKYLEV